MNSRSIAIINAISVVFALSVNYLSQAFQINGNTVGGLSDEYANLFTPAGYAFSIWGLIFLGMIAYAAHQLYDAFTQEQPVDHIQKGGIWFALANGFNGLWVVAWLYEYTGTSVIIMVALLFSLLKVVLNGNMTRWDAPLKIIAFHWWPICIYVGWISVALIANVSAYLAKIGWEGGPLSEEQWTIIMIAVATLLNLVVMITRSMREFAAVGIWSLMAIYVRHADSLQSVALSALAGAIILGIAVTIHAYRNRRTLPFVRAWFEANQHSQSGG